MTTLKRAFLFGASVMLAGVLIGTSAQAQNSYSLVAGSGGQAQIGGGLPLPIQVFLDGSNPTSAGTFPPLLVPPNPALAVSQTASGAIGVPANILSKPATAVVVAPNFASNPVVFQVNTAFEYAWPETGATFAPGGGPAGATGVFVSDTGPGGGVIAYSNSGAAFGGSAVWSIEGNQALAAGGAIPGQAVTVYINFMGQIPGTGTMAATGAALVGATAGQPQYGATLDAASVSTPGVAADPGFMGGTFGPGGTVGVSVQCESPCPGLTNAVFGDKGFPWTTGLITVSQPSAVPPEIFFLSGTDTRPGGVGSGNISMVTGTLSDRALSGPNANRSWVTLNLPEPAALAGAAGALFMLGACHSLVRRRR